jgi:hypothetical protein
MRWFQKASPPAPEPELTGADYLATADADLKLARELYADACRAVAGWNARHPEYSMVDGKILRQFFPNHPEWRSLKSRESQTHKAMCEAMEHRAALIEQYRPESKHIAGVLAKP